MELVRVRGSFRAGTVSDPEETYVRSRGIRGRADSSWIAASAIVSATFFIPGIYPGLFASVAHAVLFFGIVFGLPIFFTAGSVVMAAAFLLSTGNGKTFFSMCVPFCRRLPSSVATAISCLAPIACFLCVASGLALKIAFVLQRASFTRVEQQDLPSEGKIWCRENWCERTPPPSIETIGIYRIDAIATDRRGGTYFRTLSFPDMIDTVSWGFALRPNTDGSPFGAAGYRTTRLAGDWHVFTASNDWH